MSAHHRARYLGRPAADALANESPVAADLKTRDLAAPEQLIDRARVDAEKPCNFTNRHDRMRVRSILDMRYRKSRVLAPKAALPGGVCWAAYSDGILIPALKLGR